MLSSQTVSQPYRVIKIATVVIEIVFFYLQVVLTMMLTTVLVTILLEILLLFRWLSRQCDGEYSF